MKILVDTNIVLDVMLKREPYYRVSAEILGLAKKEAIKEYVSASAITDIYYLAYRQLRDKSLETRRIMVMMCCKCSFGSIAAH